MYQYLQTRDPATNFVGKKIVTERNSWAHADESAANVTTSDMTSVEYSLSAYNELR
jgi:hypothetical protein